MKIDKIDLVNMIKGIKPNSISKCCEYEKQGLMYFSGNQWNEDWDWNEEGLLKRNELQLEGLYQLLKVERK